MKIPEERTKGPLRPGITVALLAAALFGISTPFTKKLLSEIQPLYLAGLLYLGSGTGLSLIMMARNLIAGHGSRLLCREAPLKGHEYLWLTGAIVCGGVLAPMMLTMGLSLTYGSVASLLLNLEGLLTGIVALALFKEAVGARIWAVAALMLLGSLSLSYEPSRMTAILPQGSLLVVGACLMWAFDNNLTRALSGKDPFSIARLKGLAAGACSLTIAAIAGEKLPSAGAAISAMTVGAFCYGASLVFFVYALRHLGSTRTGALFGLGPFIGAVASVLTLREPVTWMLLLSALCMGLGTWILVREEHIHEHTHEPVIHEHRHNHEDTHHAHGHLEGVDGSGEHCHLHQHEPITHCHSHTPELHHRHIH